MSLAAYGINHQSTPLAIREKLFFHTEDVSGLLHDLLRSAPVEEAVLLSTCNRTEIYAQTEHPHLLEDWLLKQRPWQAVETSASLYRYQDEAMIRHLIRVASGLDSLVLGEPQILGQLKKAYSVACEAGTVGGQFKRLFPAVFSTSKLIRYQTDIGKNAITLAYVTVQLAKRLFPALEDCKVLLVGAGETAELLATHWSSQRVEKLWIANRTSGHARQLADACQGVPIQMEEIPVFLREADILITATSSRLPIIGKGMVESVLKLRKRRPIFMADLAVPRDVESEVKQLEEVHLYDLDDLQTIVKQNWTNRAQAAKQAEAIASVQVAYCLRQLRLMKAGDVIGQLRSKWDSVRQRELQKAVAHFKKTQSPLEALNYLAHNLTNQLSHPLTVKLRDAACEEQVSVLLTAKELFDL